MSSNQNSSNQNNTSLNTSFGMLSEIPHSSKFIHKLISFNLIEKFGGQVTPYEHLYSENSILWVKQFNGYSAIDIDKAIRSTVESSDRTERRLIFDNLKLTKDQLLTFASYVDLDHLSTSLTKDEIIRRILSLYESANRSVIMRGYL